MSFVKREIENYLLEQIAKQNIVVLTGMRQTGKTTLLKYIKEHYFNTNSVYLSLDNPDYISYCQSTVSLLNFIKLQRINISKDAFVFLDEFQFVPDIIQKIKYISDNYRGIKFILSGSSSLMIFSYLKESLAGRKRVIQLLPFSYEEIFKEEINNLLSLDFSNNFTLQALELYSKQSEILMFGKMPKITLEKNHQEKILELEEIYSSYIQKDIRHFVKGTDFVKVNTLLKLLANQCCKEVNINSLSNLSSLSAYKVKEYLRIFEQTFIIKTVHPFSVNKRSEIIKQPKVYFLDNGIRNIVLHNFTRLENRTDRGELFENMVFCELIKLTSMFPQLKLYYWKKKSYKSEIDFILQKDAAILPIEAKYFLNDRQRIINLENFVSKNNLSAGYVISTNFINLSGRIKYLTLFNLPLLVKELIK